MKVFAETSKKSDLVKVELAKPEPKSSSKTGYKFLVSIIFGSLTIGCFWQIYGISLLRLTEAPIVSIETKVAEKYEQLPALSFCTNIGSASQGLTNDEFFDQINVKDIVEYIKVTSSYGGPDLNYTYFLNGPVETISYKYYCFTINSALKGYYMNIEKNQQVWIKLKHYGIYNSWWIFMHNSYDVPSSYEWNAIEVKRGQYVPISYTQQSFKQMENNIPDNCFDYFSNSEYTSRRDCIRKCKLRVSLRECGVVYNGIDVKKGEETARFVLTENERKCVTSLLEVGDGCARTCHNSDCQIDSYKPYIISKYDNNWNYTLVELIPPTEPVFVYKHKPSVDTKVLFYNLSGSLSVWLGLALYFLFNRFSKCSTSKNVGGAYDKIAKNKTVGDKKEVTK